jgi:hypothetical protein
MNFLRKASTLLIVLAWGFGLAAPAWALPTRFLTTIHYPKRDGNRTVRSVRVIAGIQLPGSQSSVPLRAIGDFGLMASAEPRNGFFRSVLFKGQMPEHPSTEQVEQGIAVRYFVEYDNRPGVFEEKSAAPTLPATPVPLEGRASQNPFRIRLWETCQALCQFPPNVTQSSVVAFRCESNSLCPDAEKVLPHPCCRDLVIVE